MFSSSGQYVSQVLAHFAINLELELTEQRRELVNDSREIKKHDIFCAVSGSQTQGQRFIDMAIANGCDLIIAECQSSHEHGEVKVVNYANRCVKQIYFYQLSQKLYHLAEIFYQYPAKQLDLIGITGTNGKTSTSQLIAQLFTLIKQPCAVIGTNGAGLYQQLTVIKNTTPGPTELQQWLYRFKEDSAMNVAMEVSSHALTQQRVQGHLFDIAVFTNLSRDHLDYHGTMEDYAKAKKQLFTQDEHQFAILNGDDKQVKTWLANWQLTDKLWLYGCDQNLTNFPQYVQAKNISYQSSGISFEIHSHLGEIKVKTALLGRFNVYNLLAAVSVLLVKKIPQSMIEKAISLLTSVAGRMEVFAVHQKATTIVDYAHSPDALKELIYASRQHCQGQLAVLFGCGGDRDQGKRAQMGEIAEQLADKVVLSNDNPRSEQPESIIKDILAGCQQPEQITVELDRKKAVLELIHNSSAEDVILLAGKGHEKNIILADKVVDYNERAVVKSLYEQFEQEVDL